MGRAPCCDKANVKRGPWSPEEDSKLKDYIEKHGTGGNWIALPHKAGLKRCGKSCRLRWLNYLRPNIKHGEFSEEEDRIICTLYVNIGSRWSIIAAQLPGRTDNDIKNYWNTKLKKKLMSLLPSSFHMQNQNQNQNPITPMSSSMYIDYFAPYCNNTTPEAANTSSPSFTCLEYPNSISLLPNSSDHDANIASTTTSSISFPFYQSQQECNMVISPMQYTSSNYYNNHQPMFVGSEGSCSSSSDGSCREIKQEEIGYNNQSNYMSSTSTFDEYTNKFMVGNNYNCNINDASAQSQVQLDYDLEDIKQLISVGSSNGFMSVGEIKGEEKGMYNYYY